MADLALSLEVFISSATDVTKEREVARKQVLKLQKKFKHEKLLLKSFLWEEDLSPGWESGLTKAIREHLDKSELVIVIFGSRYGLGTIEELKKTIYNISQGETDDVFVYFKKDISRTRKIVNLQRELMEKSTVHFIQFSSTKNFKETLEVHLTRWLLKWLRIPTICEYALINSESQLNNSQVSEETIRRLGASLAKFDLELTKSLSSIALISYQKYGTNAHLESIDLEIGNDIIEKIFSSKLLLNPEAPLHKKGGEYVWSHSLWFFYFAALGLKNEILKDNFSCCESKPFINPIHQILSALSKESGTINKHIENILIDWLSNKNNKTVGRPIVRNFAAYQLGMLKSHRAENYLAEAIKHDKGDDVKIYSILAIGKLRSRKFLPLLIEEWTTEQDKRIKLYLSKSISNIIGITKYPL